MLTNKLLNLAKMQPIMVFFDMDGTIAELNIWDTPRVINNEEGFYLKQRPLKCVLKQIKKLAKNKNIVVGLLSYCHYPNQEQDKLAWISKYAPFIDKNNVHIIVLSQTKYSPEQKDYLKAEKLQEICNLEPNRQVFFVEDDKDVMKATHNKLKNVQVVHVTAFVK